MGRGVLWGMRFNHYSLLGDGYYSQAAQSIVWPLTWVKATNYIMTTAPSNFYYSKRKCGPNCVSSNTIWTIQFNDRIGSDNSLYLIHILSTDPKDIKCCKFYTQQMTSDCTKLYSRVTDSLSLPCNIDSCYSLGSCRLIRLFEHNVINDFRDLK